MNKLVDIEYDFRTDANGGDVDKCSATLRKYHKVLWSKPLPDGNIFSLDDTIEGVYLYHKTETQEYFLSSDTIVVTYSKWIRTKNIIKQIPENEINNFLHVGYTIGSYIIFPGRKINNLLTINQDRGRNSKIHDRFDITLECIRRYYNNETSPLGKTLQRYNNYFKLFKDFNGYCDFFLLQDLILDNYSKIKFFLSFDGFEKNPYPKNVEEYLKFKENSIEFNQNRNKRIQDYVNSISG